MIRKIFILFSPLVFILSAFSFSGKTICYKGIVTDQNGTPLENVAVTIHTAYQSFNSTTDKNGTYIFQNIPIGNYFIINTAKKEFLSRSSFIRIDTLMKEDTVFMSTSIRNRKTASINTSQIDKKDLGITLSEAIIKFKIDTNECSLQTEPPGISRGIQTESGDSTIIYLQIERTPNFQYFKPIMNKKIIGIGLAFPNCTQKSFGEGFVWWGIKNPYCKN